MHSSWIENVSVHKNLSFLPCAAIDDNNKWLKMALFCKEAGIDQRNMLRQVSANKKWNKWGWIKRDQKGHWWIRLKAATKFIENYRYGKLKTNQGHWWSLEDLEILQTRLSHRRVSEIIDKNINAVKIKRSKMGIKKEWIK